MNLLFISNNTNNVDGGLNWSVPASVKAQQKYDNVLWVDLTVGAFQPHWGKVEAYHNIRDFGKKISLKILPKPFDHPDCVIFEGFYYIEHVLFAHELRKKKIPYIIIPRGSFTKSAFHNGSWFKFVKKKLAHMLIFNRFIYGAKSIQYLTNTEKIESEKTFKTSSFIIPNGITLPTVYKKEFSNSIKGVFIGRQDIIHKGIDLLLEAIYELKDRLQSVGFHLDIYGPPRYDYKQVTSMIHKLGIQNLVTNREEGVSGAKKADVLISSDIFFLTSRFEGHPMGLIEALSFGLPVLVTRGSNMLDEVKEKDAGWTCETNKESIKTALIHMITQKKIFINKSMNARNLASEYNWDILACKLHNELELILQ